MAFLGVKIVHNHADYRLASRKALDGLMEHRERNLFLRGIFPMLGFRNTVVEYDRKERAAGTTKYPVRRMLAFAIEGVTSFSVVPLRIVTFLGLAAFLISVVLTVWAFWQKYTGHTIPGWSSLIISIYFLGAVQLVSVGLIGEYIGKIYREVKGRPRYLIAEELF
jgi:glycosyltransferase involved in cell wall biosynthesis